MIELENFRLKYPDYNDINDIDLANMLAKKYPDSYGDLPKKVATAQQPKVQPFSDFKGRGFLTKPGAYLPTDQIATQNNIQDQGPKLKQGAMAGAEVLSDIARPVLQGVGGGIGAIAGTVGGTPGVGTIFGGGLGFAAGTELANRLDELLNLRDPQPLMVELRGATKNVAEGSMYEAGGQAIAQGVGAVLRPIFQKIPFTKLSAEREAGRILEAQTDMGPLVVKNIDEANYLEETIPGLKFTRAQKTGSAPAIQFERARAGQEQLDLKQQNTEALQNFIQKAKGLEGPGDVISEVSRQKNIIESGVGAVEQQYSNKVSELGGGVSGLEAGQIIRKQAKAGQRVAEKETKKLFEDVPEFEIDASPIVRKIDELSKPFNKFEIVEENVPKEFARAREIFENTGRKATPQDLQGLRNSLTTKARNIERSAEPNKFMTSRMYKLIGEIDDVLKQAGESNIVSTPTYRGLHEAPTPDYGAPGHNLAKDIYPDDIYGKNAAQYYGHGDSKLDKKTVDIFNKIKDKPNANVKIYRAVPPKYKDSKITEGDWVTINKDYAIEHGESALKGEYGIIEKTVKAKDIFTDGNSFHEWGYWPEIKTSTQAIYKDKIIYPAKLNDELADINKRIAAQPKPEPVIDIEKTSTRLRERIGFAADKQKGENAKSYQDRIVSDYKRMFKEDPPGTIETKVGATGLEKRKLELENILSEAKPIELTEMEMAADKLKTAQQFFKKEVIGKFGSGSVSDILRKGMSGNKVSDAQIVSKFFRPGQVGAESANEFINAFGNDKIAMQAIEDAIKQDLLTQTNPLTGELTTQKLKTWLAKNRPALENLGIRDKFKNIELARKQLDDALKFKTAFEKSEAAKMLGYDPEKAIKKSFSDGKEKQIANQLMRELNGNKKAVKGLQNSIIDAVIDSTQPTAKNPLGKGFKKYEPVFKIVFKNDPQKLKALMEYRRAYEIISRLERRPIGTGSDTADNLKNIMSGLQKGANLGSSRALNILKAVGSVFKKFNDDHVDAILNRAAYDPEFATTLKMAALGKPVDMIERRLKGHLISIGLRTGEGEK